MARLTALLLLLPAFLFAFTLLGQSSGLNRAYVYGNLGVPRCRQLGVAVHGFRYFSLGYSYGVRTFKTGPVYHPNPGLLSPGKRLKESYAFHSIYVGLTTPDFHKANVSVMAGPSWLTFNGYEHIKVQENPNSHAQWVTYDEVRKRSRGVAIRSELVIRLGDYVGLQLAVEGNINQRRQYVNCMIGICVGRVDNPYSEW